MTEWIRSSFCNFANRVEVKRVGEHVYMRDSAIMQTGEQ
jgi:hypothetical protein